MTAEEITGSEYEAKWAEIVAKAPGFGEYQKKTSRVIRWCASPRPRSAHALAG